MSSSCRLVRCSSRGASTSRSRVLGRSTSTRRCSFAARRSRHNPFGCGRHRPFTCTYGHSVVVGLAIDPRHPFGLVRSGDRAPSSSAPPKLRPRMVLQPRLSKWVLLKPSSCFFRPSRNLLRPSPGSQAGCQRSCIVPFTSFVKTVADSFNHGPVGREPFVCRQKET